MMTRTPSGTYVIPGMETRWPARGRLPAGHAWSVTTILGILDKPGLRYWYGYQQRDAEREAARLAVVEAQEPIQPGEAGAAWLLDAMAARSSRALAAIETSAKAMDLGSLIHAAIEARLLGERFDEADMGDEAKRCLAAWAEWVEAVHLDSMAVEQRVYSEVERYAGTLDCVAELDGSIVPGAPQRIVAVIDWKTSGAKSGRAIYPEWLMQVSAYSHAYCLRDRGAAWALVVRLPKTTEAIAATEVACGRPFEVAILSPKEQRRYMLAFLRVKDAHDAMMQIEKRTL